MKPILLAALQSTQQVCQGPLCGKVGQNGNVLADLMGIGMRIVFIIGGLVTLIFLVMGAIQFITSGGDKEKTNEARDKITHAAIGMILLIVLYGLWIVLVSDVLGIFGPGGAIQLPTLGGS
jgi:hypothetical protein